MFKNAIKKSQYVLLDLFCAALYGVVLYFAFTWLAGYSLLLAYFGNLALIILALVLEEWSTRVAETADYARWLSERPDRQKMFRYFQEGIEGNISIKTDLYLAYFFILIFSQIIELEPTLVSDNLSDFIHTNAYSILLLIAFDRIIGQFSKERDRMKKLSARLKQSLAEAHDN